MSDLSLDRIQRAAEVIDPVFRHSPQFVDDGLNAELGRPVLVKVETVNPLRSFKGRGADFLLSELDPRRPVVCSSMGNFGQGVAYAGRARGFTVEVFVPRGLTPAKLARIRAFGATVTEAGSGPTEAKAAARAHAADDADRVFVEDGRDPAIAEGAGTIGVELLAGPRPDTVVLPVGDGALITGVARWLKEYAPEIRVIGACAARSPSMLHSWRAGRAVSAPATTIAEGIKVSDPIPESVARVRELVDDLVLVEDEALLEAMRLTLRTLGLPLEPAGAAGLAAIATHTPPGDLVATVLTGGNIPPDLLHTITQP